MESLIAALPINQIAQVIERLPTAILTLLAGYVMVRLIQAVVRIALRASHVTKALQPIVMQAVSAVLWVGTSALVLQSLGLNQLAIALSGSLAIIGIGLASGANKLVSDVVAGLFLARNRDFKIGEEIKINDATGRIHSLDARKVRILGEDGTLYVIPNTKFDEVTWQLKPSKDKK